MRLLFEIDKKDYTPGGTVGRRPSSRAIIFKDGLLAVIYSKRQNYVKIPGGGVDPGEDNVTAMIREVKEEAGLTVIPKSVKEYGYVHRIQRGKREDIFIQDNFYYLCEVDDSLDFPQYTEAELEEGFMPMFITIDEAISINTAFREKNPDDSMIIRELRVLQIVKEEIANK